MCRNVNSVSLSVFQTVSMRSIRCFIPFRKTTKATHLINSVNWFC